MYSIVSGSEHHIQGRERFVFILFRSLAKWPWGVGKWVVATVKWSSNVEKGPPNVNRLRKGGHRGPFLSSEALPRPLYSSSWQEPTQYKLSMASIWCPSKSNTGQPQPGPDLDLQSPRHISIQSSRLSCQLIHRQSRGTGRSLANVRYPTFLVSDSSQHWWAGHTRWSLNLQSASVSVVVKSGMSTSDSSSDMFPLQATFLIYSFS